VKYLFFKKHNTVFASLLPGIVEIIMTWPIVPPEFTLQERKRRIFEHGGAVAIFANRIKV
jgi:hypothetical protein